MCVLSNRLQWENDASTGSVFIHCLIHVDTQKSFLHGRQIAKKELCWPKFFRFLKINESVFIKASCVKVTFALHVGAHLTPDRFQGKFDGSSGRLSISSTDTFMRINTKRSLELPCNLVTRTKEIQRVHNQIENFATERQKIRQVGA